MTISRRTFVASGLALGFAPLVGCDDWASQVDGQGTTTFVFSGSSLLGLKMTADRKQISAARTYLLDPSKMVQSGGQPEHVPTLAASVAHADWSSFSQPDAVVDVATIQYGIWKLVGPLAGTYTVEPVDSTSGGCECDGHLSTEMSDGGRNSKSIERIPNISTLAGGDTHPKRVKPNLGPSTAYPTVRVRFDMPGAHFSSITPDGADKWRFTGAKGIRRRIANNILCKVSSRKTHVKIGDKTLTLSSGAPVLIGSHPVQYLPPPSGQTTLHHFMAFYDVVDEGEAPLPVQPAHPASGSDSKALGPVGVQMIGPVYCPPALAEEP